MVKPRRKLKIPYKFSQQTRNFGAGIRSAVLNNTKGDTVSPQDISRVIADAFERIGEQERQNWLEIERWADSLDFPSGGALSCLFLKLSRSISGNDVNVLVPVPFIGVAEVHEASDFDLTNIDIGKVSFPEAGIYAINFRGSVTSETFTDGIADITGYFGELKISPTNDVIGGSTGMLMQEAALMDHGDGRFSMSYTGQFCSGGYLIVSIGGNGDTGTWQGNGALQIFQLAQMPVCIDCVGGGDG